MEKKIMAELEKCYSIAPLTYQGEQHIQKKRTDVFYLMPGERKKQRYGKGQEAQ